MVRVMKFYLIYRNFIGEIYQCSTVGSLTGLSDCICNIKLWGVREYDRARISSFALLQTKPQTMSELWPGQGSILSGQSGKAPMFWWVRKSSCVDAIHKVSFHYRHKRWVPDGGVQPLVPSTEVMSSCTLVLLLLTLLSGAPLCFRPRLTFLNFCTCQAVGLSPCLSFTHTLCSVAIAFSHPNLCSLM